MIATSRSAKLGGLDRRAEVLEERAVGVEEVVARRRRARVDDPDVLPLLPEQARHPHFRAQRVAVGPDVRGDQEPVVRLDQVGQWGPVDAHDAPRQARRNHAKPHE